jgi:hypothetical protein
MIYITHMHMQVYIYGVGYTYITHRYVRGFFDNFSDYNEALPILKWVSCDCCKLRSYCAVLENIWVICSSHFSDQLAHAHLILGLICTFGYRAIVAN